MSERNKVSGGGSIFECVALRKSYLYTIRIAILLFSVLLLCGSPAKGQVDISPGVRVGLNSSSVGGDTDAYARAFAGLGGQDLNVETSFVNRTGYTVGAYALLDFSGPFALQPELRYIQRGFELIVTVGSVPNRRTTAPEIHLDYVDIPILARYEVPVSEGVSPHVFAGPAFGFNIKAESVVSGETNDESEGTSGTDVELEMGAGVDFDLSALGFGTGAVTLDGRYGYGLTNLIDSDQVDYSIANRALMVTLGYRF